MPRWKANASASRCGSALAARSLSRGEVRTPLPDRSVQRTARTCQGARASASSGRTAPATVYPTTASGTRRRARSAQRPETYLKMLAVASAAPSITPSASALPPIDTRNAGRRGTTISLATSPSSEVMPRRRTLRGTPRRLLPRDAPGDTLQHAQRRTRIRGSFGPGGVDSVQRLGECARNGVEVAQRQIAVEELTVARDLLDCLVDELPQRTRVGFRHVPR